MRLPSICSFVPAVLLLSGCASREAARPAADTSGSAGPKLPARVASLEGFSTPESVLWDADQQVWFVSNINGSPGAKDGNGFISRLSRDGAVDSLRFVAGGRGGVTLNGPKGMALMGDTLWVADIDAVRGFDRKTGAPVATVEFGAQARFLNDIAAAPDATLYITDTGITIDDKGQVAHPGPDRIFALTGRTVTIAVEGAWLSGPNGITWDRSAGRFVVVPFGGANLFGWKPGSTTVDTIGQGPGSQDGVEFLNGMPLISSWADSSVFMLHGGSAMRMISGIPSPADIGVDSARHLVAIPVFTQNRVELWKVE